MILQRRHKDDDTTRAMVRRKVDVLSAGEILNWCDAAGTGVATALNDYRREGSIESLIDAQEGLVALLGCLDVLKARAGTPNRR